MLFEVGGCVLKKDVIVCIGTVGRPTFEKCYEHVIRLSSSDPRVKHVEIIRDHPSQASWLNSMAEKSSCFTWCLQVDEDMYVDENCIDVLISLSRRKESEGLSILNSSGLLFDIFLKQNIGSLKLWRSSAIRKLGFVDTMGVDREIYERGRGHGYSNVQTNSVIGLHDSAPTVEIGISKYYYYVKKIIRFGSIDKAKRFIINMEKSGLDERIVNSAWRAYNESFDT